MFEVFLCSLIYVTYFRQSTEVETNKLTEDLRISRHREEKLKEQIQKLVAQSEVDEDCNRSLQVGRPCHSGVFKTNTS